MSSNECEELVQFQRIHKAIRIALTLLFPNHFMSLTFSPEFVIGTVIGTMCQQRKVPGNLRKKVVNFTIPSVFDSESHLLYYLEK